MNGYLVVTRPAVYDRGFQRFSNDRFYWYFDAAGGTYAYTSTLTDTSDWHHVMLVFDGNQTGNANRAKVYLDGANAIAAFGGTVPATLTFDELTVGFALNGSYFNGSIDDVRIYDRALTEEEIHHLASGATSTPIPTPRPSRSRPTWT